MKEKVYLDATIPSYYFDERATIAPFIAITRKWWDEMSRHYDLYVSDAVLQELQEGNYPKKSEIISFASSAAVLEPAADIVRITDYYLDNFVMPKTMIGDAVHLAYASYYGIEYLLTWNCNHLANANKKRHIRVINGRLGLMTPEIVTPLELFQEETND